MNFNKWIGIGKVSGTPNVSVDGASKRADINFAVSERRKDANGQWVEAIVYIPVYAYDQKADVIQNYVVDGQELTIEGKILTGDWGWGVILINVELGFKPRSNTGGGAGYAAGPPAGPPM